MHGILGPQRAWEPDGSGARAGLEAVTSGFLEGTRRSALVHFSLARFKARSCHTLERTVPPPAKNERCNGTIVAHVSARLFSAWGRQAAGPASERAAHVRDQVQLALQDLSDQDMHGYLALTQEQCDVYGQDLVQLVTESLGRTTFARLGRKPDIHWEGTLVRSLQPPVLVLVLSIG